MVEPVIHTHARTHLKSQANISLKKARGVYFKEFIRLIFVYQNIEFINNTWKG